MHVVLMSIGSAGDIHPLVRVGAELRDRGHSVTLSTVDVFQPLGLCERLENVDGRQRYTVTAIAQLCADPDQWVNITGASNRHQNNMHLSVHVVRKTCMGGGRFTRHAEDLHADYAYATISQWQTRGEVRPAIGVDECCDQARSQTGESYGTRRAYPRCERWE